MPSKKSGTLYAHTDLKWSNASEGHATVYHVETGDEVKDPMDDDVRETFENAGAILDYPRVDVMPEEEVGRQISDRDDRIKELETALAIARGEPDPHASGPSDNSTPGAGTMDPQAGVEGPQTDKEAVQASKAAVKEENKK